jgi:hypothetical protein
LTRISYAPKHHPHLIPAARFSNNISPYALLRIG